MVDEYCIIAFLLFMDLKANLPLRRHLFLFSIVIAEESQGEATDVPCLFSNTYLES